MTPFTYSKVSVILPTLNEAGNIEALIRDISSAILEQFEVELEIIVVDDNSPDLTWQLAERMTVPNVSLSVVRRLSNPGLTNSLREGISRATGEVVVWMDCDFSHPPEKIPQILFMIGQGFDVAVNTRYGVGGGEERSGKGGDLQLFLSRILNWSTRFFLDPRFSDYTSGFIATRKSILQAIPLQGDYGEYFVDFIFRALRSNVAVCELPYTAPPRRKGISKTGTNLIDYIRRGRKYLMTIFRVRFCSKSEDLNAKQEQTPAPSNKI